VWVRLDDSLGDDPRLATAGPMAYAVLTFGLCYSNRNLTDGWIPATVLHQFINSGSRSNPEADAKRIDVCFAVKLLSASEKNGIPGYQLHDDYVKHQPTRATVLEQRRERSLQKVEAGRLGGVASGKARRKQKRSTSQAHSEAAREAERSRSEAPIPIPILVQKEEEKREARFSTGTATQLPRPYDQDAGKSGADAPIPIQTHNNHTDLSNAVTTEVSNDRLASIETLVARVAGRVPQCTKAEITRAVMREAYR
jgi:hypothetical protein